MRLFDDEAHDGNFKSVSNLISAMPCCRVEYHDKCWPQNPSEELHTYITLLYTNADIHRCHPLLVCMSKSMLLSVCGYP